MPPWFAEPGYGEFTSDPRLTDQEIQVIDEWVASGAAEGKAPRRQSVTPYSTGFSADVVVTMPVPVPVPAGATLEPQYIFLPLPFTYDRWVRGVEILPSAPTAVDHAILYVRPPRSTWLSRLQRGTPYMPSPEERKQIAQALEARENILGVYTPGASTVVWPEGMAKKIPTGSDLILEIQYINRKTEVAVDQTQVGLMVSSDPPRQRVVTLRVTPDGNSAATLPVPATLLGMRPYSPRVQTVLECDMLAAGGAEQTLLRVKPYLSGYAPHYALKTPRQLPAGTVLQWTTATSSGDEKRSPQVVGYFDIAIDPEASMKQYFAN
jgi:hypothetical protein